MSDSNGDEDLKSANLRDKKLRWPWLVGAVALCGLLVAFFAPSGTFSSSPTIAGNANTHLQKNVRGESRVIAMSPRLGNAAGHSIISNSDNAQEVHLIDMCGFGIQPFKGKLDYTDEFIAFSKKFSRSANTQASSALESAIAKLLDSDDDMDRATGLYARMVDGSLEERTAQEKLLQENPECLKERDCTLKLAAIKERTIAIAAESLIKLAMGTSDPNVFAAAYYHCRGHKSSACSAITAEKWASLDSDNAAVWLAVASDADERKNEIVRDAALLRASQLSKYQRRSLPVEILLGEIELANVDPTVQMAIVANIFGLQASSKIGFPFTTVFKYCKSALTDAPDRKGKCENIASLMQKEDQTFIGQKLAARLGERSGWAKERVKAIIDETDAYIYLPLGDISIENSFSCESIQAQKLQLIDALELGELEAAKKYMLKMRLTPITMVEKYHALYPDRK